MRLASTPHVILSGNPLIGYQPRGPYKDYTSANAASEPDRAHEGAEIFALKVPEEGDGTPSPEAGDGAWVVLEGCLELGFKIHGVFGSPDDADFYTRRLNGPTYVVRLQDP